MRRAQASDARALAAIHAQAFDAPWGEGEMAALLEGPGGYALLGEGGFILCRAIADEAEILTLAVIPEARRQGLARGLVEAAAALGRQSGAQSLFLEVAEDNVAAIGLYRSSGFEIVGHRPDYYQRADEAVGALVMRRALNRDG